MSRIERLSAVAAEAWKNGGGVTRTLARQGDDWRVSLATIDRDGAYSSFAGLTRLSLIIEGAGITLRDGAQTVLLAPAVAAIYDGAPAWQASLHGGTCTALNVMAQAGQYRLSALVLTASAVVPAHAQALLLAQGGLLRLDGELEIQGDEYVVLDPAAQARVVRSCGRPGSLLILIEPVAHLAESV